MLSWIISFILLFDSALQGIILARVFKKTVSQEVGWLQSQSGR
jgi:hypothetical protein